MAKYGRERDELKILPAMRPIVGSTRSEAEGKYQYLQDLLDPLVGLSQIAPTFGDLSAYQVDAPVPLDAMGPREMKSAGDQLVARIQRDQPSIKTLYEEVAGGIGTAVIGTPSDIADHMQLWFESEACDGFNITPDILPFGCEDFVVQVVPELQRRGLFRTEYEASTLRGNLGLKPVRNRYCD